VEASWATESVIFHEAFTAFLEEHPEEARGILGKKISPAMKARKAAKSCKKDSIMRKGAPTA